LTLQEGMNHRDDIPLSQFDLNTYIQGICRQYGAISSGRNIQFSLNLPTPSRVIVTDPDTLRLALRPILDNAVKFTDSGGRVDITVSLSDTLDILVTDTGCGMDAETLYLADKPFFMRDNSFSRRHQGAGIGLSVARNSLNILQGTSKIKSREGIGTEVAISIPITYGT
ncbi:MAG: ATP-binding protein, partial [Alphaproteobacteria bacterium]|nr:ATP-binding protein [Alphaproteobacteria bacterium]